MSQPLLTGVALKDATVRDYRRAYERAGIRMDGVDFDRLAVSDLELADNFEHEAKPKERKADPVAAAEKHATLEQEAEKAGAEIVTGQMVKRPIASLHASPKPGSKWSFALGRLARILARPSIPSRKPWEDCEIPRLAKKVYELKAFVTLRHLERIGGQVNPLYGLNPRDFERKFRAMTMQICDESSGRMGPWWVPK